MAGLEGQFCSPTHGPLLSNTPGCSGRYEGEECFNESRFRKYLDEVFVPMAEYAVSKGLYVISALRSFSGKILKGETFTMNI